MTKGITIWINGVHFASSESVVDVTRMLLDVFKDHRNEFLRVHVETTATQRLDEIGLS